MSTSNTPQTAATPTKSMEELLAENEQLRMERRLLLKALFPPEPEEAIDLSDYFPVSVEDLLNAAHGR